MDAETASISVMTTDANTFSDCPLATASQLRLARHTQAMLKSVAVRNAASRDQLYLVALGVVDEAGPAQLFGILWDRRR